MSKIKAQVIVSGITSLFVAGYAHAIDLSGVYNQALKSDPTYKVAEATWLSAKENLPLSMVGTGAAGTGLFPNLAISGLLSKNYQNSTAQGANNSDYNDKEYALTLTQPIFNLATWSSIREAGFGVKSAYATYIAAGQNLINSVATAYFEVLRANENLQYTIKEKEADKWELITDLQKYKVGLSAVTGVYNSQASYDQQIAIEISDRTTLRDNAENLRVLTSKLYTTFRQLPAKLPTVVPAPANMSKWVAIATKQSYAIKSAQMTMLQAKQAILTSAAGVAPTVNAVGNYNYDDQSQAVSSATGNNARVKTGYVGLALNFPLIQGGYTIVNTKQTRANYLEASDNLALTYANTTNSTRQSYLSITSGIAQIDADYQTIIATQKNLEATRAAYLVGTRTMVDVLIAISQLYNAKKEWAGARYDYVEALFQLKYDAGTLGPKDIATVNSWLRSGVKMQYTQPSYKKDPYYNAARIEMLKHPNVKAPKAASKMPAVSGKPIAMKKKAPAKLAKKAAPTKVAKTAKKMVVLSAKPLPAKQAALPAPVASAQAMELPKPA